MDPSPNSSTQVLANPILKLQQLFNIQVHEMRVVLWSFLYFFCLLCSYYILRPMRDEMGVTGGVEHLQWLFTATFIAMLVAVPLFGWVSSRFPRRQFLPYVYYFFISCILLFFILFKTNQNPVYVARAFFVWTSVFNLFVVSVFWSFMTDIYNDAQAKRLFGFIAAGGTVGAITGPTLTSLLAVPLGPGNLLLISVAFLMIAVVCIHRLSHWQRTVAGNSRKNTAVEKRLKDKEQPLGGGVFEGIQLVLRSPYLLGIALLMVFLTMLATFLYFQQAQIIRDNFADSAQRTAVFAAIDLAVNTLTILTQVFITGRLTKWLGLSWTLALIPLVVAVGFFVLGFAPVLAVLITLQIVRRAGNYAVMRPAREMLYVVLSREEKYKAKNVNDTVVYRGGDAVSGWIYAALRETGLSLGMIAWIAVPIAGAWAVLAFKLGKRQTALSIKLSTKHSIKHSIK